MRNDREITTSSFEVGLSDRRRYLDLFSGSGPSAYRHCGIKPNSETFSGLIRLRLTPRRDSAARRRPRSVLPQSEQLLRGAARDSARVTCARGVSLPPPVVQAFLRTWRRKRLLAQLQDSCSTHRKHVGDHAFRIHHPIAAMRARPPSPPTVHRRFFPVTNSPIPVLESTSATVPQPSNRPMKQIAHRHHAFGHAVCPRRRAGNSVMPLKPVNGTFLCCDPRAARAALSEPSRKNLVSGPARQGRSGPGGR